MLPRLPIKAMSIWRGGLLTFLLIIVFPARAVEPQQVRFRYALGLQGYDVKLLQHALNLTQHKYGPATAIKVSNLPVRIEIALMSKQIDVAVLSSNPRRNEVLFPIPSPLTQGMLGYRLLAVTSKSSQKLTDSTSLKDFQHHLIGGVALHWEDFRIYNHNKLLNSTSHARQQVFDKLSRGEIDYFSRGLHEIFRELEDRRNSHPNLEITSAVAFYYPFDYYYYTPSPDSKLTKRIMEGLAIAEKDGSMKQLFQQSFAEQIRKLKEINPKRVIGLDPPDDVPSDNFHYKWWLTHELPSTH